MKGPVTRSLEDSIKLIAAVGAAAAFVVWLALWIGAPTHQRTVAMASAAVATVVYVAVWRVRTAPPIIIVVTAGALTVFATAILPAEQAQSSASVALVMMAIVGVALLRSHRRRYITLVSLVLLGVPLLSDSSPSHALMVGSSMALSVAIGGSIVYAVILSKERLRERNRQLFQAAPVPIIEQDWTTAVARASALGLPTERDLADFLVSHPDDLQAVISEVSVVQQNDATNRLWKDGDASLQILTPDVEKPDSVEAIAHQTAAIVFGGRVHDLEYDTVVRRHGHPITVQVRSIIRDDIPGAHRVLVMVNDVTARARAKRRLERALESKDQFIASVSHELRTPLAAVVGMTAMLLEGDTLHPADRELLEIASQQSNEMAHIIEDLLVAARADARSLTVIPEVIDPAEAATNVVNGYSVTVSNPDGVLAWADPVRLRQILRNLVTNAQRYGVEPVDVTVRSDGDLVAIEVSDHGDPIPESARTAIFDPYERVDPEGGLTASVGLGLAVSRTLARLMDGDLQYRHDGRSVFSVTVPRPPAGEDVGRLAGARQAR